MKKCVEIRIMLLKTVIQNTLPNTPRTSNPKNKTHLSLTLVHKTQTKLIKHLEQTKEINNKKKKAKMLGPGAQKDKEN